jgi:hypothetical protein
MSRHTPPNPYAKVEERVPYKPEPTDDEQYQPKGQPANSYAIDFAAREVAKQMEQENKK